MCFSVQICLCASPSHVLRRATESYRFLSDAIPSARPRSHNFRRLGPEVYWPRKLELRYHHFHFHFLLTFLLWRARLRSALVRPYATIVGSVGIHSSSEFTSFNNPDNPLVQRHNQVHPHINWRPILLCALTTAVTENLTASIAIGSGNAWNL